MKPTLIAMVIAWAVLVGACVAAPGAPAYGVTPIVRQIGADEAMQIVRDATSTAGVVATRVAESSATERAAAVGATAAHRQTQDTLAMRATEQHLALLAGQATERAVQTLDRATQAAQQTALWATPTVAALQTQGAVLAAQQGAAQASRESAAEFWQWLRWLTLALVGVGGVCGVVVAVVWAVALVRVETLRQKAAIAHAAFRLMPGHWGEWTPNDGYQVYPLPALTGAPAVVEMSASAASQPTRAHAWRWRAALKRAVFAGIEKGLDQGTAPAFGERDLAGAKDPVIVDAVGKPSSAGYRAIRDVLVGAGIWVAMARKDTVFAPEWGAERFEREFDTAPLPNLPPGEPPEVLIPYRSSAAPQPPQLRRESA